VTAHDGLVGDVFENHRLADAIGSDEHGIMAGLEEAEGEELVDGFAVDALRPGPIEVGHRLEGGDARAAEAALEAPLVALALFEIEHLAKPGLVGDVLPRAHQPEEPEALESQFHLGRGEVGHEVFSVFKVS
jgi:hypothetical protein